MEIFQYGKAICYSGYREGQSPKTEIPSKEQIAEDLNLLVKDGYSYIRMYDPNDHARRVLETIREQRLPMKCLVGIDSDAEVNNPNCPWIRHDIPEEVLAANKERNDAEVEKLIQMAKEFDEEIIAVSIGNENTPSWGAHMVPTERLIRHARRLREALDKPITFCEGAYDWPPLGELGDLLDFISIHSYPYHYGDDLANAVAVNKKQYEEVKALFPGKQVIFTELGWPTNDDFSEEPKRSSVINQEKYLAELMKWLEEDQIVAFLFEAFDEPWKGETPDKSECNWGLYDVNRIKKW